MRFGEPNLGALEPFVSVTASSYATTEQRFIQRGKAHLEHDIRQLLSALALQSVSSRALSSAQ